MFRESSRIKIYLRKFIVVAVEVNCVSSQIQLGITSLSGNDYVSYVIRNADRNFFSVFNSFFLYLFLSFFPPFTCGLLNYAVSNSDYTSVESYGKKR